MGLLFKNTLFSSITLGLRFLSSALLLIIIARVLGVEEFGRLAFALSFTGIFLVIVDYGFNLLIVREVARTPGDALGISNQVISGKIILSLIATAIIVGTNALLRYPFETQTIIYILWLAAILYSFGLFLNTIFRGLNQFEYETYPTILLNAVQFALVVILLAFHYQTLAIAWVYLCSRAVYFLVSLLMVSKKIGRLSFVPDFLTGWNILKKTMPFGIHAILATIYFQIDTVFLSHYRGNVEVGYYQAAMRVVVASMIIYDVIASSFYPLIAKKFKFDQAGFREDGLAFNKYMLLVGGGLAVSFFLFAEVVIRLLYGNGYEQSIIILRLLSIVIFLRFAGASYAAFITVADDQRLRAIGVGVSVVISVILNMVLIPDYGGVGAAVASILTHIVLDGMYCYFSARLTGSWFIDRYCSKGLAVLAVSICACFALKRSEPLSISIFILFMAFLTLVALNRREKASIRNLITKLCLKEP